MSSQRRRSRAVPSANRGYHASGTDTTRPSWSPTTRAPAVTRTSIATGLSVTRFEIVMPGLQQLGFVLANQAGHLVQLGCRETKVVLQADRCQPELGRLPIARDVNVHWLPAVAREEEEAIGTALKNRRAHGSILPASRALCYFANRLTNRVSSALPRRSGEHQREFSADKPCWTKPRGGAPPPMGIVRPREREVVPLAIDLVRAWGAPDVERGGRRRLGARCRVDGQGGDRGHARDETHCGPPGAGPS